MFKNKMLVYNIRRDKYAASLSASGVANRWNRDDEFVIYTSGSIALSTLELVANRNSIRMASAYKVLFIGLSVGKHDLMEIRREELPENWKSIKSYPILQNIGSDWYWSKASLILKVPSAIIPFENNYIINTAHLSFAERVSVERTVNFEWDERLL